MNDINNKKETYTCIYCKRTFGSMQALKGHLKDCKKRSLPREFEIGGLTFVCYMNPRKKIVGALNSMRRRPDVDERQFLGAVRFLEEAGIIHKINYSGYKK